MTRLHARTHLRDALRRSGRGFLSHSRRLGGRLPLPRLALSRRLVAERYELRVRDPIVDRQSHHAREQIETSGASSSWIYHQPAVRSRNELTMRVSILDRDGGVGGQQLLLRRRAQLVPL